MVHIMKRNFLRHKEFQPNEIKTYLVIIECMVKGKSFRPLFDQQVKDRVVDFFNVNKDQFTLANFKKLSQSLQNFRYPKNSEQYKLLESCIQEKFAFFYPQMDVNDIVPISRLLFRGPEIESISMSAPLEQYLLNNQEKYINGIKKAHEQGFKDNFEYFNKCLLYLEGTLMVQKLKEGASEGGMELTEKFAKALYGIKHNLTHSNISRIC